MKKLIMWVTCLSILLIVTGNVMMPLGMTTSPAKPIIGVAFGVTFDVSINN